MSNQDGYKGKSIKIFPEAHIEMLQELDGRAGTFDISDEVGCTYRTTYVNLRDF